MSKRRVNKQQTARINKLQEEYRHSIDDDSSSFIGLVLSRFGRHAEIEDEAGNRIHCSVRPNIDSLVAGDKVIWQAAAVGQGVVVSRFPRKSTLGRHDKRGLFKPAAANISQILIVVAPKPELSWLLLDSYLVMAENLNLKASIVLNKIDIPCDPLKKELLDCYFPLGYPVLMSSANFPETSKPLINALNHEVSVFVGQSGVGKSSLIASVLPHEQGIQTGTISESSELGCHTTSNSRFYHIPTGGALIDSPGVRELGLWHMASQEIAQGYREFRQLIGQCKFRNCDHKDNPGCAITAALRDNSISQRRYNNFIKLISQFAPTKP
nr:small ribosomal subunit biogenesis GTPase RsgA [Legionella jordanis]